MNIIRAGISFGSLLVFLTTVLSAETLPNLVVPHASPLAKLLKKSSWYQEDMPEGAKTYYPALKDYLEEEGEKETRNREKLDLVYRIVNNPGTNYAKLIAAKNGANIVYWGKYAAPQQFELFNRMSTDIIIAMLVGGELPEKYAEEIAYRFRQKYGATMHRGRDRRALRLISKPAQTSLRSISPRDTVKKARLLSLSNAAPMLTSLPDRLEAPFCTRPFSMAMRSFFP